MTVDELIQLTEALLADVTLAKVMAGDSVEGLSPEEFVLLVRFLGGERPVTTGAIERAVNGPASINPPVRQSDPVLAALPDEEEAISRGEPVRNVLADRGPNGRMVLGGEFDGVELP